MCIQWWLWRKMWSWDDRQCIHSHEGILRKWELKNVILLTLRFTIKLSASGWGKTTGIAVPLSVWSHYPSYYTCTQILFTTMKQSSTYPPPPQRSSTVLCQDDTSTYLPFLLPPGLMGHDPHISLCRQRDIATLGSRKFPYPQHALNPHATLYTLHWEYLSCGREEGKYLFKYLNGSQASNQNPTSQHKH